MVKEIKIKYLPGATKLKKISNGDWRIESKWI